MINRGCKNGEVSCGQYYTCGKCKDTERRAAYARLTPEQKAYHTDYDREQS